MAYDVQLHSFTLCVVMAMTASAQGAQHALASVKCASADQDSAAVVVEILGDVAALVEREPEDSAIVGVKCTVATTTEQAEAGIAQYEALIESTGAKVATLRAIENPSQAETKRLLQYQQVIKAARVEAILLESNGPVGTVNCVPGAADGVRMFVGTVAYVGDGPLSKRDSAYLSSPKNYPMSVKFGARTQGVSAAEEITLISIDDWKDFSWAPFTRRPVTLTNNSTEAMTTHLMVGTDSQKTIRLGPGESHRGDVIIPTGRIPHVRGRVKGKIVLDTELGSPGSYSLEPQPTVR